MKKKTIKRRLFYWSTGIVFTSLVCILAINLIVIKFYSETVENGFKQSLMSVADKDMLQQVIADYTVRRQGFQIFFAMDVLVCMAAFFLISWLFTRRLAQHIIPPLNELTEAAKRVEANDLTIDVMENGDWEFQQVCQAFNHMQHGIREEQQKNRSYEQARANMLVGLSHDMRTPLTAVQGTIKGVLDGVADTKEKQTSFLKIAYQRSQDMDALLEQMFFVSKLETGSIMIENESIVISEFIQNYVIKKEDQPENQAITFNVDLEPGEQSVLANREQLERVLDNLVENSKKYAKVTDLELSFVVCSRDDGVRVIVKDNGVGVPSQQMPFLFDEFYRGDESRTGTKGNGLGLFIVKSLMQIMGGSAEVLPCDRGFGIVLTLKMVDSGEEYGRE